MDEAKLDESFSFFIFRIVDRKLLDDSSFRSAAFLDADSLFNCSLGREYATRDPFLQPCL